LKIKFCGGARSVTGSCFLLKTGNENYLIDCGMFQGGREIRARNIKHFPFHPPDIDYLLLTHAHIDHSGLIPRLVKEGFRGKILATEATFDLVKIMLPDSAHIQEMEAEWVNRKNRRAGRPQRDPLYTMEDANEALKFFEPVEYNELYVLSPRVAVRFFDAGHILGSAIIKLWVTENEVQKHLVFSGDLGKYNQPIICDPSVIEEADYLFMESTYGSRLHEHEEEKLLLLEKAINETKNRGGNVIIPSFAVGRTQEMLYSLNRLIEQDRVPSMPIYIDSPMAISATEVFSRHPECFDLRMRQLLFQGEDPFHFPEVTFTPKMEQSRQLNEIREGAIIISASGMCDAGRIKHHLKHNLWRPESTVVLVGYQAEGTLGRQLLNGVSKVKIFGEEIVIRAQIVNIDGFSAHADRNELLHWVSDFIHLPQKIFLVHGEEEAQTQLASHLKNMTGVEVDIPDYMDEIEINFTDAAVKKEAVRKEALGLEYERWERVVADLQSCFEKLQQRPAGVGVREANWLERLEAILEEMQMEVG